MKNKGFKKLLVPLGVLLIIFLVMQSIRPALPNPPVKKDFEAPADVKNILVRACYDCHSNQTNLRWYDKIQPVYWQVAAHVKDGRKVLNFSDWGSLAPADQKAKLWEAVNQIIAGAMPIKSYAFVHPDAKVSGDDIAVLKNYLAAMVHDKPADTAQTNALFKQVKQLAPIAAAGHNLPEALNGISYIPDYKNWQVVTTSDRFDNGTMRVIFGNDVAIKAVKNHQVNPWPNGTIFAKVAWDKLQDKDGNVRTGAFKQVEYMIKDDQKYATTKGWGFARFKTLKLVPYGKTALFANECVSCHKPMSNNDLVFTLPVKN
ncbi:heme-binding domain-containing protein [Mucilaginibacter ginsenosidivorax]|uniref:Cytochrome P460 n=1 Tax=Mucilaginibacter ginsenosidivorax TaxID=862126 RepID=A0A5B8VZ39_9SPHI|nr:heme-binding domain-containing protein [Mucilaginibacter ginsenosidivorax]QEC75766.1 cytochrome P460 [Mucilaginibacter ginsenosidivorax]